MVRRALQAMLLVGCGAAVEPRAPLPEPAVPKLVAAAPLASTPPPLASAPAAPLGPCGYVLQRYVAGGSGVLAPEVFVRMYDGVEPPLTEALCRCREEHWPDRVVVRAVAHVDRGTVTVSGVDLEVGSERALACMEPLVAEARYQPLHVGSDCIGCAGWHLGSWPAIATSDEPAGPTPVEVEARIALPAVFVRTP